MLGEKFNIFENITVIFNYNYRDLFKELLVVIKVEVKERPSE